MRSNPNFFFFTNLESRKGTELSNRHKGRRGQGEEAEDRRRGGREEGSFHLGNRTQKRALAPSAAFATNLGEKVHGVVDGDAQGDAGDHDAAGVQRDSEERHGSEGQEEGKEVGEARKEHQRP